MLKHQISSNEQNLKHENLEKIEKISHFDYGWNGNGGLKFTREAIDAFRRIIDGLNRQPKIAPTGRNSLFINFIRKRRPFRVVLSFTSCQKKLPLPGRV